MTLLINGHFDGRLTLLRTMGRPHVMADAEPARFIGFLVLLAAAELAVTLGLLGHF